jgi:hypothetical protein
MTVITVNQPKTRKDPPPNMIPSTFLFFKAEKVPYAARSVTNARMMTSPMKKPPFTDVVKTSKICKSTDRLDAYM